MAIETLAEIRRLLDDVSGEIETILGSIQDGTATVGGIRGVLVELQMRIGQSPSRGLTAFAAPPTEVTVSRECVLPWELLKLVFFECDAQTRSIMGRMNRRAALELSSWSDVRSVHLTRLATANDGSRTIIVHGYRLLTNSLALGPIQTSRLIPMLYNLRNVKTMLVESSSERILDRCNRIAEEDGFFALLRHLESVKVCSVNDNLGVTYSLSDFFGLRRLRILHIREFADLLRAPPEEPISAPIEDLRLCTHRMYASHVVHICRALAKTLRRLELLITMLCPDSSITFIENRVDSVIQVVREMTTIENLTHITLARVFVKPAVVEDVFRMLKSFRTLRSVAFEQLDLSDFPRLANDLLPSQCNHIIVHECIRIGAQFLSVCAVDVDFFTIFNGDTFDVLRRECRSVERDFTLQFGRLRGFDSLPSVHFKVGLVSVVGNSISSVRWNPSDGRVFLFGERVLTRTEYLALHGVELSSS